MAPKRKKSAWPSIQPKPHLQITPLKDTNLFTVQNFFTSAESKAFIEAAESIGFVHQGSLGPTKGQAFRDNDRISLNDPTLAETIWESGLKRLFADIKIRGKVAVGLNPNIRFYRYRVGQRFGRHIDESVDLGEGRMTLYTLLIYLSGSSRSNGNNDVGSNRDSSPDSLVGGETVFYDHRRGIVAEVAPIEGMALLHIHGDKCLLHEAHTVTKNVKHVMRSDVAFVRDIRRDIRREIWGEMLKSDFEVSSYTASWPTGRFNPTQNTLFSSPASCLFGIVLVLFPVLCSD